MRGLALALVVVIATAAVACANSYSAVGALELSDETYGSCVSCVSCVLCVSCVGVAARWLVSDESLGFRCKACVNRVADICIYIYIYFFCCDSLSPFRYQAPRLLPMTTACLCVAAILTAPQWMWMPTEGLRVGASTLRI